MPDPAQDDTPPDLTVEQARAVAACVSQGSNERITTPVVIALMSSFPGHDWLSMTLVERHDQTFRDMMASEWDPDAASTFCRSDPREDLKHDLRNAEAARVDSLLRRKSVITDDVTPPAPSFTDEDVEKAAVKMRRRSQSRTLHRQVNARRQLSAVAAQLGLDMAEAERMLQHTEVDPARFKFRPQDLILQRAAGKITQAEMLRGALVYDYCPPVTHDADRGELSEWTTHSESADLVVARHLGLLTPEELSYFIERRHAGTGSAAPGPPPTEKM